MDADRFDDEIENIRAKLNITEKEMLYQMAGDIDWRLVKNGVLERKIREEIQEVF